MNQNNQEIKKLEADLDLKKEKPNARIDLERFTKRIAKKPLKAKIIKAILIYSRQKASLDEKGIKIVILEEKLEHLINKWSLRNLLYTLHQKGFISIQNTPIATNKRRASLFITEGKSPHLLEFQEKIDEITGYKK